VGALSTKTGRNVDCLCARVGVFCIKHPVKNTALPGRQGERGAGHRCREQQTTVSPKAHPSSQASRFVGYSRRTTKHKCSTLRHPNVPSARLHTQHKLIPGVGTMPKRGAFSIANFANFQQPRVTTHPRLCSVSSSTPELPKAIAATDPDAPSLRAQSSTKSSTNDGA